MNHILNIGKSGLKANQYKMDAVADNLANVNTRGYKSKEVSFQELLNNEEISAGSKSRVGKINFQQGTLVESPFEYHMAIEGNGFFGVIDGDNNLMLTRNGSFHINEDKTISDENGYPLVVDYLIPVEEWGNDKVQISRNGEIKTVNDDNVVLGRIILFYPENLDSLISLGEGRYLPAGEVQLYDSLENEEIFGEIHQYFLEASNADIIKNIVEMITTQRAYSLSLKAVQTTDEMMNIINGIKR